MAAADLPGKLSELNGLISAQSSPHSAEKAQDLVVDLGHLCLRQLSENELAYCCSELFNKDNGILVFLNKAIPRDEFKGSKEQLLEFLHAFLLKAGSRLLARTVEIKKICISAFMRDKSAKVKTKTFPLLIELLQRSASAQMEADLDIPRMIEQYFEQLMQPSKLTQTVKQGIYGLLGVLAEVYPVLMSGYSERLLNVYIATLNQQMTSKTRKPELTVIAGCLTGLGHYLVNFTQSVEEGAKHSKDIYRFARMAIDPNVDHARYELNKAGLNIFAKHSAQFSQYLYNDHRDLHEAFNKWSSHSNPLVKSVGFAAQEAFLQQIAEMLVERAAKREPSDQAVFRFFVTRFRGIIDNPQSDARALSSAIRGYGYFAAPCKLFMTDDDVKFMFTEMIQRSEQLYLQQGEVSDDKLNQLPNFLEALASIIRQLDMLSDTFLAALERLIVVQVSSYPRVPQKYQFLCHRAVLLVLIALAPKGATLKNFLSRVVYQALVQTCSHPVMLDGSPPQGSLDSTDDNQDMEADMLADARHISYNDYVKLWASLLDSPYMKEIQAMGMNYADRRKIHIILYDELISSILKILGKLDLTSVKETTQAQDQAAVDTDSTEDASSDPVHGLHATKPKDFQIFINLVDFCRDLLPANQPTLFKQWVYRFGHEVILLSSRLPLVSGFYKLLTVCMSICSKIQYFKAIKPSDASSQEDSMEVDLPSSSHRSSRVSASDCSACFTLFAKFSKEVLVRLKQYKDDLLASCLLLVLSLPHEIVKDEVAQLVAALQMTFRIGLSYLPLAETGLEALEGWMHHLPSGSLRPHLKEILPLLDGYLRGTVTQGADVAEVVKTVTMATASSSARPGKRKLPFKLVRDAGSTGQTQDSPLRSVQLRIMQLLGSLGGQTNACLLETSTEEVAKVAVAWDTKPRLQFAVPFYDMKPNIELDQFLPRVVELALTSGDRQTKVAACESLHTLVLYMLGKGTQQPEQRQAKSPMQHLYRRVFPALLRLACDVELVARQLFEPLVMQLIHWFTGNKKYESEETSALLNAMLDGVIHPTDTSLRDFSARCLKEFLRWSIKQTSKKQQEKSPINTKSLLKRLYSMALHPSSFKRLGAALTFNHIYTVFREEDSLIDQFICEILVIFVNSLALAHHDDKSLGTQLQGVEVLNHLERIIRVKADMLNKDSKTRRSPREFPVDVCPTLSMLVIWLLRQCGRAQTECRHQCMMLIYKMTPLLPGRNTPQTWMQNTLKEKGPDYFVSRFEGGGVKATHRSGISKYPSLSAMGPAFTVKLACTWFEHLLAALDCYTWIFGEKLLSPSAVFTAAARRPSVLFQALHYFLSSLSLLDITGAARSLGKGGAKTSTSHHVFTPRESEDYSQGKCTVIVRLWDFLTVVLGNYAGEAIKVMPKSVWQDSLFDLLVACVLQPTLVGFNMADVEIMNNLPKTTGKLLSLMSTRLPANLKNDLSKAVTKSVTKTSCHDLAKLLPSMFSGDDDVAPDHGQLSHLVKGYEQLHQANLLSAATAGQGRGCPFPVQLFTCVFDSLTASDEGARLVPANLTPVSVELAGRLLELAFQLGIEPKMLVSCILDKTSLSSGNGSIYKGVVFYSTFKTLLNGEMAVQAQKTIPLLVREGGKDLTLMSSVLNGLLDYLTTSREIRKKHGMSVHSAILTQWGALTVGLKKGCSPDLQSFALLLLRKLLQIDAKFVSDTTHPAFKSVLEAYAFMLTDTSTSLTFKAQVMEILFFFTAMPDPELAKLRSALDRLVADNFPLNSSEFRVGSPKYNDYVGALNKILTAMVLSGNLMLLELIISVMCRDERHACEDDIQESLAAFIKRLPEDKQTAAFDVAYRVFCQENSFSKEIRRAAIERVCIPLMRLAGVKALVSFFKEHIKEVAGIIDAKTVKVPESAFQSQLVSKMCCFQLVELMYSRLTKEDLFSMDSVINKAYTNNDVKTGKEMTQAFTKASHAAKSEDIRGETNALELRRQYHCAAYNTLIAVISCTQTDIKFYNAFLFSENTAKGQFLLDNITDVTKDYVFEIEMNAPMERKKRFVSIRNQVRDTAGTSSQQSDSGIGTSGYTGAGRYLSSQYLANSSLSEDIQQFDFSGGVQQFSASVDREQSLSQKSSLPRIRKRYSDEETPTVVVQGEYIEMESDALNQHECMASLTAVLKHMQTNKITPEIPEGTKASEMPGWMANLQKKLTSQSTHVNIKLFIARLIINNNEVFQPYAKFWLSGLIQLLITGNAGGEGIHYMVVDIVVVLLGWATVAIPEDKRLANKLLEFLMHFSHHSNRQVLRNNLEMIKTLVECWREIIAVPTSVIYRSLANRGPDMKDSSTGIQLLGLVLANGLHPINKDSDVDEDRFYAALSSNLKNRYKMVHAAAAEVIGMTMKQKAEVDKVTDGFLHSTVSSELSQISAAKPDVFVTCMHRLHLHYPEFADSFINKLLFMLPSLYGQPKTLCMEVIVSRVNTIPNVFLEMKSKGIVELLTHRDEGTQLVSLKLVNAMLPNLKPSEILYLLPPVRAVFNLPSPACREVMYDILMWIYDNFRDEESRTEDGADDILSMAKDTLLQGLSDEEATHRLRVSNFWSHETRLPTSTLERLVAMLECMYSAGTEHQYLSYATSLLLEMTSKSPDYKREIFEHPLSECKFQEMPIDHSWKQRHLAISTPMFVETQSSQGGSPSQSPSDASLSRGEIRATQEGHQFIATQDLDAVASRKNAYNWLTGSQDTFADYSSSSASDQSSLLFTLGVSKKTGRGRRAANKKATDAGFGKEKLQGNQQRGTDATDSKQGGEEKEINRLKRRFLKDHSTNQAYFARREMKRKQMKEKILDEQRERRFSTVTMYRRYRAGDLPDIQIKYSDLIAPLQALAQRDATLARLLFSSLFRGIFSEIEEVKTEREAEATKADINRHLNTMLSTSTQYFPPFISCIQEIGYYHSNLLTLDPSSVSTASLMSQQMHIGIRLLEENLIQKSWREEKSSKRAKHVSKEQSPEISTWIELARLYKALADFDAVQGVFSSRIGTHEITKTALEAEARGDYSAALKLYNQAFDMDWDEGSVSQVEEDLWDESRLNCCNQLTQWKDLQHYSTVNVDDNTPPNLSKMWSDTFYQEQYLPHMMRSMLKQLMDGGEDETLLQFIDESMSDPDKRVFLEARFSEELSCLYTIQEDYDRAMFYLANCRQSFLQDWSGLGPLMTSSRTAKLQCIQRLTETQDFLKLAAKQDLQGASGCQKSLTLLDRWTSCHLDAKKDPVSIWDDVVSNRFLFMDKLAGRFIRSDSQQSGGEQEATFEKRIAEERLWLGLKMADSACQQGNFSVAQKHLKATHGSLSSHEDLRPQWTHSYVQMNQLKILTLEPKDQVMTLLTTFDPLAKLSGAPALTGDYSLARHHHTLTSKSYDLVAIAIQKGGGDVLSAVRNAGKLDKLLALVGKNASRPEQICSSLYLKAHSELKHAVSLADKDETITPHSEKSVTEAYMALVSFCDKMLRLKDSEEVPDAYLPATDTYSQTVVRYTLKAMHYSSQEAMQRFPRLLQLVEACPDAMQLMIQEVSDVPCWMFIGWISQMVALLDKPEGPAVHGILTDIANEYPQALCYPFKISSESFNFDESATGKKNAAAAKKIGGILETVPLVENFIAALEQLNNPEFVFKDWADDVMKPLLNVAKRDKTKIRRACQEIYNNLIDHRGSRATGDGGSGSSQDSSSSLSIGFGNFRRRFAQDWQKKFEATFGKDGSKVMDMPWKIFLGHYNKLYNEMNAKRRDPPGNLKEYSTWFSDFQQLSYDRELEIPGQYGGKTKPLPEYHVKIAGFDEQVKVLSSMRKPKRLVIRGNDEHDYSFLVKGGEDLRLDQRVEQLFRIMNGILEQDATCSQRGLRLITYEVIPMTPRLGMIEWAQNTTTLKDFLHVAMTDQEVNAYNTRHGPRYHHTEWVDKYAKGNQANHGVRYGAVYRHASYTDTVKSFRTWEALVPWDLMRRAFIQMSASPEAFLTLRAHFARSHAVICICQYILGIGDRHLSNFLLSLKTGGMIGIDFGHAFGSATQFLPVPELMPFRLTRQIINLMLPFKKEGILQSSMVHTLRALRQNHELLINTMDVFIKEPSLDWKTNASKQAKAQKDAGRSMEGQSDPEGSSLDEAWYPREKVSYAQKKLEGANPADITKRELNLGHSRNPALSSIKEVLKGDRQHNIRASSAVSGLNVETQVECLIDQATDPNILGRVYAGWEAWM